MLDSEDESAAAALAVTDRVAIASGCTSTAAAAASSSPVPVLLVVVTVRDDGDSDETVVGDDDDDEGEISTSVNSSSSSNAPPPALALVPLAGEIVDVVSTAAVLVSFVGSILIFYLLVYIVYVWVCVVLLPYLNFFHSRFAHSPTYAGLPSFDVQLRCCICLFFPRRSVFFLYLSIQIKLLDSNPHEIRFFFAAVYGYPSGVRV